MNRLLVSIAFVAVMAATTSARAATESCAGLPDGTPCAGDCIEIGLCERGVCVVQNQPGTSTPAYAPDGSECSSGNLCTSNDYCSAGRCIPGQPVQCDAPDACHAASCDPMRGCVLTYVCDAGAPPDLAPTPDLAPPAAPLQSTPANPTPSVQAAPPDMAKAVDLAAPPDQAPAPAADLAGGTSSQARSLSNGSQPYVRGDAVAGGCSAVGGEPASALPLLLVAFALLVRRRRAG